MKGLPIFAGHVPFQDIAECLLSLVEWDSIVFRDASAKRAVGQTVFEITFEKRIFTCLATGTFLCSSPFEVYDTLSQASTETPCVCF